MTEPTPQSLPDSQPDPAADTQPTAAARPAPAPEVDTQAETLILPPPQPVLAPKAGMPFHYYLLWLVALVSLGLNIFIIKTLLDVRQQAAVAFEDAAAAMGNVRSGTIEYTVQIDERIPVALDVPVQFTVEVPIKRTIPINTVVQVPLEIPLFGTRLIDVPIRTTIPIDLTVEVPINQSVPINGIVPVKFEVPIRLDIAATTFGDGLRSLQLVLQQQADSLQGGE